VSETTSEPTWSNKPFTEEELARIIDLIAAKHDLRRGDAERLVRGRDRATKRNPLLELQWVELTLKMCRAIRESRAQPAGIFEGVFWVRLYGCLTDLRVRFAPWADSHHGVPPSWPPYRFLAAASEVSVACHALRDCLSDDELVYVAFVRQVQSHVYQDGFEYSIERGNPTKNQRGAVRTKQTISPLGRHVDIDQAHEIVDRIHLAHGNDKREIARSFANKVHDPLVRLYTAMVELRDARNIR
jgi:hypothetical protein